MSLKIYSEQIGQSGQYPRRYSMESSSTLAEVTTAGYLSASSGVDFIDGDFISTKCSDQAALLIVSIDSSGVITLNNAAGSGSVPTYVEGITPGTSAASKALVLNASSQIDGTAWADIVAAASITVPAYVESITPGTSAASKAIVLDGSSNIDGVAWADILAAASGGGGAGATQFLTSSTPVGGGSNITLTFQDSGASNIDAAGFFYFSDSVGNPAATGITVLTGGSNGTFYGTPSTQVMFSTNQTAGPNLGKIDVSIQASPGTYYITWIRPSDSSKVISDPISVV